MLIWMSITIMVDLYGYTLSSAEQGAEGNY